MSGNVSTFTALRRAFIEVPILGRRLWVIVLLNLGGTGIQILVPVLVQQSVDRFLGGPERTDVGSVVTIAVVGITLVVIGAVLTRMALARLIRQAATGLSQLRVGVFAHLMRRSVLHVETERRGALVSRVTSDVTTLQEFMEWGGIGFLVNGTQVVLALAAMTVYEWRLALLVLVGVVIYAMGLLWFQRVLRRSYDKVRVTVADSLAVMGESIQALPAVRAYAAEEVTMERVDKALEDRFQAEFKTAHFGNMLFSTAELFAATLTTAVVVVGLLLGPEHGVTAGVLLAFIFLVNLLIAPIQVMVEILDFAQSAASGLRRVIEVLDAEVEIPEAVNGRDLPSGVLGVDFDRVSFRYDDSAEVLTEISVSIEPGSRVAVVGQTGSGKTTFAKLVVRLLDPASGTVRIGGLDLRDVSFASLRSRLSFVPQEGFLFTGTVGSNVRYGKPSATDAELERAFADLGLSDWLHEVGGLDAHVGERGSSLSAGERQLVALTRAWLASPALLVLDEATSAVDPALDVALRHAIDRLTEGRTSITIAHRLATAQAADDVLVFDRGRLVEQGRHGTLIELGGVYASLYADWATGTTV